MNNWKELPLNDVIELVIDHRGKTPKKLGFDDFFSEGYPVLSAKHVKTSGLVNLDAMRFANEEMYKKWMKEPTQKGDVILTSEAPLGELFYIDGSKKYVLGQRVFGLRPKSDVLDSMYLLVWLSSAEGQGRLQARATGSTVQGIKQSELLKIMIPIPPMEVQKDIASIYGSLDQKIQLNTQINQTLEQIAQALFKSWFVDFDPVLAKVQALSDGMSLEQAELAAMQAISGKTPEELTALSQAQPDRYAELAETAKAFPCEMEEVDGGEVPKGWKQTTLSEICEMQNGYAFKSSEWTDAGIPVIKIGSIQSTILTVEGNGFVSEDNLSLRSNFVLNDGDIVIGLTGAYVGKVGRMPANKRAMLNQRVAKFLAKKINKSETFYSFIYMNVIQEEFKNFVDFTAQGSAQPNISTKDILKYPLLLANNDVHLAFEKLLKKILDKSIFNSYQNEILSNSRDLLLPRLLDGEI